MSKLLISQYYRELDKIIQRGGSLNENSIRPAFQTLLNDYLKPKNFTVVSELYSNSKLNKPIRLDGIIKDDLGLDWGYWESITPPSPPLKGGLQGGLNIEIEDKFNKGYPNDNILFENSITAILIQKGQETMRISMKDPEKLDQIINAFINYIRPEVKQFRDAIELFKQDLPTILTTLRELIDNMLSQKPGFSKKPGFLSQFNAILNLCQESINPNITREDVREMIIQHILTEDIFLNIFNEVQFHRENNIARQLQEVINTFLTGATKRNLLSSIERYYNVIRSRAANIVDHHQKQEFLKIVYENFYQAYNPLFADRLGIIYTPNEIVKFMIESTDYLLHKHFNKLLEDRDVEILDPATGTGTFITEIIEYLNRDKLEYKYLNEIHCNEVAILPYYIANLNIEYSYKQKMGKYLEFNNICFVDTLDNMGFDYVGKQGVILGIFTEENTTRIKRQNDRKISVIIGNPPYNANQQNENDHNKNREYPAIDQRIKDTYVKESNAQKTKRYDMYSRFFRWATDRLNENGIICLITNNNFLNSTEADGFRKVVKEEFDYIYVIDLGGDIRAGDKSGNVFNIMVGVAITFLVKQCRDVACNVSTESKNCQIFYNSLTNLKNGKEKLQFLAKNKFDSFNFEHIQPDDKNNWINLTDNDFDSLLSLANKETKLAKKTTEQKAIFKLYSLGASTNRDEWVTDISFNNLKEKMSFFVNNYNQYLRDKKEDFSTIIKWSRDLKSCYSREISESFDQAKIILYSYRPYSKLYFYKSSLFIDRLGPSKAFFNDNNETENKVICLTIHTQVPFVVQATNCLYDAGIGSRGSQGFPLYTYDDEGNRQENITDWGLQQFREYYSKIDPPLTPPYQGGEMEVEKAAQTSEKSLQKAPLSKGGWGDQITKEDIFYYIYGVLHNPKYREKYELNLKREFPRIPFYDDFNQWKNWGQKLMELHINYETIKPYPLIERNLVSQRNQVSNPKPKLKVDKTKGQILIDDVTTLTEIPPEVWEYKLGNRSAIEWILDQYKEKKVKDSTITEKFNNYRFSDYKEQVIDLLKRVTTVSVETMKIIKEMDK